MAYKPRPPIIPSLIIYMNYKDSAIRNFLLFYTNFLEILSQWIINTFDYAYGIHLSVATYVATHNKHS